MREIFVRENFTVRLRIFLFVIFGLACLGHASGYTDLYNFRYLTVREGLCDNTVHAIHKDCHSFMWFGTSNGLDRYDGYEFRHYSTASASPDLFIENNYINDLEEDKDGHLWVATESGAFYIDLMSDRIETFRDYQGADRQELKKAVQCLASDGERGVWMGRNDGLVYVRLDAGYKVVSVEKVHPGVDVRFIIKQDNMFWVGGDNCLFRLIPYQGGWKTDFSIGHSLLPKLHFTSACVVDGRLWLGTQEGLYSYDAEKRTLCPSVHSGHITSLACTASGNLVIGTRSGIKVLYKTGETYVHSKGVEYRSLNDNFVNRVWADEHGNIWVGSEFGGITLVSPARLSFSYLLRGQEKPYVVSTVLEDREGNVLVGFVDGGLAIRRKGSDRFVHYVHRDADSRSLAHDNVSKIIQAPDGNYWISTIGGGLDKLDRKDLSAPVFRHFNTGNSSLLSDNIYDIALDSLRNSLWLCSDNYIHTLSLETQAVSLLRYFIRSGEVLHHMNSIFVDSRSRLWIGGNGLGVIDLENSQSGYECIYYRYKLDRPETKIGEKITCMLETPDHTLYFGSLGNGIYRLESGNRVDQCRFVNYASRSGLTDMSISSILCDAEGDLWISSLNGIYFFDRKYERAFRFDQVDGLLTSRFYKRAGCSSADHSLLLGTTDGLVTFKPLLDRTQVTQRKVVFTGITCDGFPLAAYRNASNMPVSSSICKEVHLYPPQNSLEVSFSCLDYLAPEKVFYAYRIIGLDKFPTMGLMRRSAKYTNLAPGKYRLEVRCTNADNSWSSEFTYLDIIVHPPFYRTTWFSVCSVLFVLLVVFGLVYGYSVRQKHLRQLLKRHIDERTAELSRTISELTASREIIMQQNRKLQHQNNEINQQKEEIVQMSRQVEESNKEKLSYFTNMAHEFKTPLTLIQGPVKQLLRQGGSHAQQESLQIVERNASYLLSLVNQLVDLRKLDTHNLALNFTSFDLSRFLETVTADFSRLMQERDLAFETCYRFLSVQVSTDQENLHKILFNLLSNAVKFTPDKGRISLYARQFIGKGGQSYQYFSVTNTGSRIAVEDIDKIFNRFYRIESQHQYTSYGQSSTGIGLHIVKEVIALLGGKIKVRSSEQGGVSFRLYFPISFAVSLPEAIEDGTVDAALPLVPDPVDMDQDMTVSRNRLLLLLVEDNRDMRAYIKGMLQDTYDVVEAANGRQGYDLARKLVPDFILSDLMMPECSGNDFCRLVRNDRQLCHIPFVLLTANSSEEAQVESFENGADGYLTKPFGQRVLITYIHSILANRKLVQQRFVNGNLALEVLEAGKGDKEFMTELTEVLERHYREPDFNVQLMARELNLSYVVLYRKLVALTGLSPVRYIQLYRLKVAHKLLGQASHNVTVADIAYQVGFNDPKYFTRCFVKQYRQTPSELIDA